MLIIIVIKNKCNNKRRVNIKDGGTKNKVYQSQLVPNIKSLILRNNKHVLNMKIQIRSKCTHKEYKKEGVPKTKLQM